MRHAIAVTLLLVAGAGHAAPLTWSLTGVEFDDGASATGTFVFDADTNSISDINITVTGGTSDISGYGTLSADPFTYAQSAGGSATSLWVLDWDGGAAGCPDSDCQRNFVVDAYESPLTNAALGTYVGFDLSQTSLEGLSNNSGSVVRHVISGGLTAVPVPAAVWLFASALAGMSWLRSKPTT